MIRRAIVDDIPVMAALLGELFTIEDDFMIDVEKQSRGLELLLRNHEAIVLVALVNEAVVGMITLQMLISTAMGEKVGLIEDFIIREEHRRMGIGKELLNTLIVESEKQGLKRLALGADHRNHSAIAFYEKQGFDTSHMGLMYRKV